MEAYETRSCFKEWLVSVFTQAGPEAALSAVLLCPPFDAHSDRNAPQCDNEVLAHAEVWIIKQALGVRPDGAPRLLFRRRQIMLRGDSCVIAQSHRGKLTSNRIDGAQRSTSQPLRTMSASPA
jgi:hypothetical protein